MECKRNYLLEPKLILGLAIFTVGVVLLLENLGMDLGVDIWDFWPVVLILFGVGQIVKPKEFRQPVSGWIFIVVGCLFLGNNIDLFQFEFHNIWPIFLIVIGISVIKHTVWDKNRSPSDSNTIDLSLILGGGDFKFTSQNIRSGKISSVMGGGKIDLREADMEEAQLILDAFVIWGSIEIRIPEFWQVTIQGTPIMAGIENKTTIKRERKNTEKQKHLILQGIAIMGGIEIKN